MIQNIRKTIQKQSVFPLLSVFPSGQIQSFLLFYGKTANTLFNYDLSAKTLEL